MADTKCDSAIHLRLPSETIDKLKAKAKKARRNFSEYLRLTLEDHANETGTGA